MRNWAVLRRLPLGGRIEGQDQAGALATTRNHLEFEGVDEIGAAQRLAVVRPRAMRR